MKEARINYSALLAEHDSLMAQYAEAQVQINALTLENQALKKRLGTFTKPVPQPTPAESEAEGPTQLCSNCQQSVPAQNFAMHQIHCERVNKRCPVCRELIPAAEFLQHTQGLKEDVPALFADAEKGDTEAVERRLAHGAEVAAVQREAAGNTLLHAATKAGAQSVVELLVAKGASVDAKNAYGETPLHVALTSASRNLEVISFLLSQGADPLAQNSLGDSPYALAMRQADHSLMLAFTQCANRTRSSPTPKPRTSSARARFRP